MLANLEQYELIMEISFQSDHKFLSYTVHKQNIGTNKLTELSHYTPNLPKIINYSEQMNRLVRGIARMC